MVGKQYKKSDLIADRFKIISKIGAGGMGTVFKCLDTVLNKEVAVKLLNTFSDVQFIRFQNEATTAGSLRHPNIIEVYDFGMTKDSLPYMVMELVQGTGLKRRLRAGPVLSHAEKIELLIQICKGLTHAHANGVLHRDIKPSNIMIVEENRKNLQAKIVDFGLAKVVEEDQFLTETGVIVGSPYYMSPEQCANQELDERSEIYSFGCLVYELFSGLPPFPDEVLLDIIHKHQFEKPAPLYKEETTELEIVLNQITAKCLEKTAQDRFQNMTAVKEVLENIELDDTDRAEIPINTSPKEEREKEATKKPTAPQSLLLVVALFLIPVSILLFFQHSKNEESLKSPPIEKKRKPSLHSSKRHPKAKIRRAKEDISSLFYVIKSQDAYYANRYVRDIDLSSFARDHKNAKGLILTGSDIRGPGLAYITDLPLIYLEIDDLPLTDKDIAPLSTISPLIHLSMAGGYKSLPLNGNGFKNFSKLSNLKNLNLANRTINDNILSEISRIKSLIYLSLVNCDGFTEAGMAKLTELPILFQLQINGAIINDEMLKHIPNMSIKSLHFDRTENITIRGIHYLTKCKKLRSLSISYPRLNPPVSKEYFQAIAKIKTLETLVTRHADLSGIDQLKSLPHLNKLTLQKQNLNYKDLSKLATLKQLQVLSIDNKSTFEEGTLKAVNNLSISLLYLSNLDSPYSELKFLKNAKNLQGLSISNCGIKKEQINSIRKLLPKTCKVEII